MVWSCVFALQGGTKDVGCVVDEKFSHTTIGCVQVAMVQNLFYLVWLLK